MTRGGRLFFVENGREFLLNTGQIKNSKYKDDIINEFKRSFNISLITFLRVRKKFNLSDKETLNFLYSLKNISNSDNTPKLKKNCIANEAAFVFDGRIPTDGAEQRQRECEGATNRARDRIINELKNPFTYQIAGLDRDIQIIKNRYKNRLGGGDSPAFKTKVSYQDVDGYEIRTDYTCRFRAPNSTDLDELLGMFPGDGSAPSFETLKSDALKVYLDSYNESYERCRQARKMYSLSDKMIETAREEAVFIEIIKNNVICHIQRSSNDRTRRIEEALETLEKVETANFDLKQELKIYLTYLAKTESRTPTKDSFKNRIWESLFNKISRKCSDKTDSYQTAADFAITLTTFLASSYSSSCTSDVTGSLPNSECHKKAIDYGIKEARELDVTRQKRKIIQQQSNSWVKGRDKCLSNVCPGGVTNDSNKHYNWFKSCIQKL